ncbi:MAG: HAD family phosphatase [Synergistales bacterium]|nr:HAD family phosphatase [Synergistales bacterium]
MSLKLIAIDLDGTLLNSENAISPRTETAIRRAAESGIVVTIATGRMYRSALAIAQKLGLDVPLITYNGALVRSVSGKTYYHRPIPESLAHRVMELFKGMGWYIQTYLDDTLYVRSLDEKAKAYATIAGVEAIPLGDALYTLEGEPTKMLGIADSPEEAGAMCESLKADFGTKLFIAISQAPNATYVEICHPEVSKGKALAMLAQNLSIKKEEIMAIGDSGNDVSLLDAAGIPVAMANARSEVKERAQIITKSNDEDGVALIIESALEARPQNTRSCAPLLPHQETREP